MNINHLIEEMLYRARISQEKLSEKLGCKQSTVSRIKTGKQIPTLKMSQKIVDFAKIYKIKVKLEDLLPKN